MPVRVRPRAQKETDPVHVATHDRQSQTPLRPHQFARFCRKNPDLPHTALRARLESDPTLSCNSSVTAIAILGTSRAHPLARWHRFVSIERPEPLQTALQGTSARAMVCRKNPNLPRTAVQAPHPPFLQLIWHGNRHSTGLQGTSVRAMVCRKITDQQPTGNTQPLEPG